MGQAKYMGLRESLINDLTKLALQFEVLFPRYIKFFIDRSLKKYKKRGLISDYSTKAHRKEKYHYTFEIDLYSEAKKGGENA